GAVRHLDQRQSLGVHDVLLADNAVAVEEVGSHRVHLVGREGAGVVERLRPADVAPERGGVLPEASNRPDGLVGGQRTLAADEAAVLRVLTRLAVTGGAPLFENRLAEHGGAAARRQALAIGGEGESPVLAFLGTGRTAHA